MNSKGQGLSITVIIVTVLALLVLVIMALVFTGKIGSSVGQIDECKGQCVDTVDDCSGEYQKVDNQGQCTDSDGKSTGQVCCVGLGL